MAAPAYDLSRDCLAYTSDDTNVYQIGTCHANSLAGGFTPVDVGTNPAYPRGWTMRGVYGEDSQGYKTFLPIMTPGDSKFVSGGTFSKGGLTFTIMGKRGEHRFNRGV